MPRQPRFFAPGVPLHVIQRGNNRQPIFGGAADYIFYMICLAYAARKHRMAIHAYVLMTNHVHLLVTPDDPMSIPRAMQAVGRNYVKYFNALHGRTGTLWEGRYRATVIHDEGYLLKCMRYIEMNPVRASIVGAPQDYRWSSFAGNAFGAADALLESHALYGGLGASPGERQEVYRGLFGGDLCGRDDQAIRDATNKEWVLGDLEFCARIESQTRRRGAPLPKGRPRTNAALASGSEPKVVSDPI